MIKEVQLLPSQLKAINSQENVTLLLCARGVGKSYGTAFYCIYRLLTDADVGMLVCPIYSMLRDTTSYLLQHLNSLGIQYSLNKMPSWCQSTLSDHKNVLSINTGNGKHVYLFLCSGDNPDFLRGKSVHFIAIDEAALTDEEIIDICTPALRGHTKGPDYNYRILLATTSTTCHNWIYKRYIEPTGVKGFREIKAYAEENIFEYTPEKIETLRSQMTDLMFRREMLCQWISLTANSVFYSYSDKNIKEGKKEGKFWISCDLNVKGLTSIFGWEGRDSFYIEGEAVIHEAGNATKMVELLHRKIKNDSKVVFLTGDRNIKNKNAIGAFTYHEQIISGLREKGWKVIDQTLNANPSVYASADKCNWALGSERILVNPSCEVLIDDLRTANWKSNIGDKFVIDKDACRYQCDAGDCLRYLVENKWPVGREVKLNPK